MQLVKTNMKFILILEKNYFGFIFWIISIVKDSMINIILMKDQVTVLLFEFEIKMIILQLIQYLK